MYPPIYEELAWAITREREKEACKMRPRPTRRKGARLSLRAKLARKLVRAGVCLDRTSRPLAGDPRES